MGVLPVDGISDCTLSRYREATVRSWVSARYAQWQTDINVLGLPEVLVASINARMVVYCNCAGFGTFISILVKYHADGAYSPFKFGCPSLTARTNMPVAASSPSPNNDSALMNAINNLLYVLLMGQRGFRDDAAFTFDCKVCNQVQIRSCRFSATRKSTRSRKSSEFSSKVPKVSACEAPSQSSTMEAVLDDLIASPTVAAGEARQFLDSACRQSFAVCKVAVPAAIRSLKMSIGLFTNSCISPVDLALLPRRLDNAVSSWLERGLAAKRGFVNMECR